MLLGIHLYILISRALVIALALIDSQVFDELEKTPRTRIVLEFEETREHRALRHNKNPAGLSDADYEIFIKNLQRAAASVQGSALSHIAKSRIADTREPVTYRAFTLWSSNEMSIENADRRLVEALAGMPMVRKIRADAPMLLPTPTPADPIERLDSKLYDSWHINMIQADEVWKRGVNGNGVVVGVVDSGAHLAHDLLATKWRKNHGWYDTVDGTEFPLDEHWVAHGTVSASVILAGNQYSDRLPIGVAPGATFIACRTNKNGSYTYATIRRCMQFMACPTDWRGQNSNCRMRPRIVNHSFGSLFGANWPDQFYLYSQARINLIVSAGNIPKNCSSLTTDAENDWPITVGAVDRYRNRPVWSSAGPTNYGDDRIKPDVIAPGVSVYTCSNAISTVDPNWGFFELSGGTSVAAPIVTGIVALMLSANPALEPDEIKKIIQETATWNVNRQIILCGNISRDTRPNYVIGWGIVNAYKAFQAALQVQCKGFSGSSIEARKEDSYYSKLS